MSPAERALRLAHATVPCGSMEAGNLRCRHNDAAARYGPFTTVERFSLTEPCHRERP